jgi:MFS family permease
MTSPQLSTPQEFVPEPRRANRTLDTSTTSETHDRAADALTKGFDRKLTTPLLLGAMLNPINSSMIAIALIPIGSAFGASPAATAWLVSSLYLATSIGQPVIGRLVDRFGPRPLYLIGAGLVGIAGLVGTLAPTLGMLVVARVLLGLGTSAQFPAAMHLVRSEAQRTGRKTPGSILTALSVAAQSTMVIGPTLGGALVGLGGWRLVFAVNIPLALACVVLGMKRLPKAPPRQPASRIDLVGMTLFAATFTGLLLFLMSPRISNLYLLLATALAMGAFAHRELHHTEPFIDLRVFGGNAPLLATYLRQTLTYILTYSFIYGFTQWLEEGRGLSASVAGLIILPISSTAIAVAWISGRSSEIRGKLVLGTVSMITATAALLLLNGNSALWLLVLTGMLAGIPQGINTLANQNALFRQADPSRMGTASGLLRTFQYLGAMLSSAAIAIVFKTGAHTSGLHQLALLMLVCGGLLLIAVLADRSLSPKNT